MDTRIYVMTHKKYTEPDNPIYLSLHVGREGKEDLGYIGDNTGDNISHKNKNYCELTGLYWLWKNVTSDIVGVCHYRRFFLKDGKLPDKDYIENIIHKYPVIVPCSSRTQRDNIYEHYKAEHHVKDLLICKEVICEKYPEYYPAFRLSLSCNLFSLGNMVITRKDIFDSYCEWLFDILFEVEKRIDISEYDDYQQRVMGFLSERLFRVWLMNQNIPVHEEPVEMLDLKDIDNERKLVDLKYRYTSIIFRTLIDKYVSVNVTENDKTADKDASEDIFGGRLPVWICWWQGFNAAPELVRRCFQSINDNIPDDRAVVIPISLQNYSKYINFTDTVVRKFNSGKISPAHMSDVLRMGLLAEYGGMWIDATYFMAGPMPDKILDAVFYTQKFTKPTGQTDIVGGRWSCNLIKGGKGNILFRFAYEALCNYWEERDDVIDYHLMDYVIAQAFDNIKSVHDEIAECEPSEPELLSLAQVINQPYDEKEYKRMTSDTVFFKLSHKAEYAKKTIVGKDTFYGHILKN